MKSTLILVFVASCLTAAAQDAPSPTRTQPVQVQPAPQPPSVIPRPDRIDPLRFGEFDVNKDGKLDLQEQAAEKASRPAWEAAQRERAQNLSREREARQRQFDLEKFDTNRNGQLDATEQQAREQWQTARRQEFLQKHDRNNDGKITPDELKPAKK